MTLKEYALKYMEIGWTPIPLKPNSKEPLCDWKVFQNQKPDRDLIKKWFLQNRHANLATITGKISGILVFDEDSEKAKKFIDESGGFDSTVKSKTARGYHYFFQMPEGPIGNRANHEITLDVKGNGGYVCVPPSVHPSGAVYEWIISPFESSPVPLPQWALEYLQKNYTSHEEDKNTGSNRVERVMDCAFLAHCDVDRAVLGEPEWYGYAVCAFPCSGRPRAYSWPIAGVSWIQLARNKQEDLTCC